MKPTRPVSPLLTGWRVISADSSFIRAGNSSCPTKPSPNSAANRRMNPDEPPAVRVLLLLTSCAALCSGFELCFWRLFFSSPATRAADVPAAEGLGAALHRRAVLAGDRAADGRDVSLHMRALVEDDVAADRVRVSLHRCRRRPGCRRRRRRPPPRCLDRQVAAVDDGVVHRVVLLHLELLAPRHHVAVTRCRCLGLAHLVADPLLDLRRIHVLRRDSGIGGTGGTGGTGATAGMGGIGGTGGATGPRWPTAPPRVRGAEREDGAVLVQAQRVGARQGAQGLLGADALQVHLHRGLQGAGGHEVEAALLGDALDRVAERAAEAHVDGLRGGRGGRGLGGGGAGGCSARARGAPSRRAGSRRREAIFIGHLGESVRTLVYGAFGRRLQRLDTSVDFRGLPLGIRPKTWQTVIASLESCEGLRCSDQEAGQERRT